MKSEPRHCPVLAVEISDRDANTLLIFRANQILYVYDCASGHQRELARFGSITIDKPVQLHVCHPYVCVSERFGLNCAVFNVHDNSMRHFSREDYHANVSSYSIAFLEREGRIVLVHQTQWNRLDITDLGSGELLTPRDVSPTTNEQSGSCEDMYYLDYFHSELLVSPGQTYWISNGWVWHPADSIRCFKVDEFFHSFEPGSVRLDYIGDYNWDRPCAFIDDSTLVVAVDDQSAELDEEELAEYSYRQLLFYSMADIQNYDPLPCRKAVHTDIFDLNIYGELHGALYYDPQYAVLASISSKGIYLLDTEGMIKAHCQAIIASECKSASQPDDEYFHHLGLRYSATHHLFYAWNNENDAARLIPLDEILFGSGTIFKEPRV